MQWEEELSAAFDTTTDVVKNVPDIDAVVVMADTVEYRAKEEKNWRKDIVWQAAKNKSTLMW